MKTSFYALLIALTSLSATHAFANDLTSAQEARIIDGLQDLGPDSWEEGNVGAKFVSVNLDADTETVRITYVSHELDSHQPWVKHHCTLEGFKSASELLDGNELTLKFSDDILDGCVR